jgi:hypothetical protein
MDTQSISHKYFTGTKPEIFLLIFPTIDVDEKIYTVIYVSE